MRMVDWVSRGEFYTFYCNSFALVSRRQPTSQHPVQHPKAHLLKAKFPILSTAKQEINAEKASANQYVLNDQVYTALRVSELNSGNPVVLIMRLWDRRPPPRNPPRSSSFFLCCSHWEVHSCPLDRFTSRYHCIRSAPRLGSVSHVCVGTEPTRHLGGSDLSHPPSFGTSPIESVIRAYGRSDLSNPSFPCYVAPRAIGHGATQDPTSASVIQTHLTSLQPGNLDLVVSSNRIPQ